MANAKLTMRSFTWSNNDLSMKQFVHHFQVTNQPPEDEDNDEGDPDTDAYEEVGEGSKKGLLAIVSTGFAGNELSNEIGADEMYFVQDIARQTRVVFINDKYQIFSIPINYAIDDKPATFNVSYDGKKFESNPVTMAEVIGLIRDPASMTSSSSDSKKRDGGGATRQWHAVYSVRLVNDQPVSVNEGPKGDCGVTARLGKLRFHDVYDEKYLVAYSVVEGGLIYCTVSAIPVYLPITLDVALGFKQPETGDFDQWLENTQHTVDSIARQQIRMCNEIILFKEMPNDEYEYVTPTLFSKTDDRCSADSAASPSKNTADKGYVKALRPPATKSSSQRYQTSPEHASAAAVPPSSSEAAAPPPPRSHPPTIPLKKAPVKPPPVPLKSLSSDETPLPRPVPPSPLLPKSPSLDEAATATMNGGIQGRGGQSYEYAADGRLSSPSSPIEGCSTAELVACLGRLKLSHLASTFIENDINGSLLASLEESILVDDLKMTRFEARKLMMFVRRGWMPD